MKTIFTKIKLSGLLLVAALSAGAMAQKKGYAEVNGLKYYYEITGKGKPLLLLHGGLGSMDTMGVTRSTLEKSYQVIAVDLHGHGRTALGKRPVNFVDQGADMASIVKSLGFSQVDVVGYSMGGGVAFQFAAQNPTMVRRLVLVSTTYGRDGYFADMLAQQKMVGAAMAPMMKDTPMFKIYKAVAPHPEEFPKLLDELGVLMRTPYDWSNDVAKLTMPVMLVFGDSDMIKPEHMVQFYHLLGGGLKDGGWQRGGMSNNRLAILPDVTHYDMPDSPQLVPTIQPFLDAKAK